MAGLITGPAADWLETRRSELNQRFRRAQRRYPGLAPERVLTLLSEILPPLAGSEPSSGDLLSAAYDLILLHAGRDTLSSHAGVDVLLREAFPHVRSLLLERPLALPAALSNAVEHLGRRGAAFARALPVLAPGLSTSEDLLDAGVVLAWRLGEARLRESALERCCRLPSRVLLDALDLGDWPTEAAGLAIRCLEEDAWRHPRDAVSEKTLRSVERMSPEALSELAERLSARRAAPPHAWTLVGSVGEFSGFGGEFDAPPLVFDDGARHRFFARSSSGDFRVDADVFGWTCRPHAALDLPVRVPEASSTFKRMVTAIASSTDGPRLHRDGTLMVPGQTTRVPELAAATSFTLREDVIVVSHADSHRLRVLAPRREAL